MRYLNWPLLAWVLVGVVQADRSPAVPTEKPLVPKPAA